MGFHDDEKGSQRSSIYSHLFQAALYGTAGFLIGSNMQSREIRVENSGFPNGYKIQKIEIPTRGNITQIDMLPNASYEQTMDVKTGQITFYGKFGYTIEPLTPDPNPKNLEDERWGTVTGTIDDKVKKRR